ncbi:MAG: putative sugar O-methyltransferase [Selenomonadaceae bacterium]|nr:putative sugar O-methyltransferase [Selenomonadaceae bacterium]
MYNRVVDYMWQEVGQACFEHILQSRADFTEDDWLNFLQNDSLGNPSLAEYNFNGSLVIGSPTTLRYVKVLVDLMTLFDTDAIETVTEVGIGYGGQCRILTNVLPIERYNLIDLPEVLALAEKFLTALNVAGDIRYIDGTHLYHDAPCDLFISDYAFSELNKPAQDVYIEKIISKATAGYVTWDGTVFAEMGMYSGYTIDEFVAMLPAAKVLPEYPVTTSPDNRLIVWGTK